MDFSSVISNSKKAHCTLSTANLLYNFNVLQDMAPNSKIMAIVKANAYGHGLIAVSQRLKDHVDAFGVASIYEAMELRQAGVKTPITLLEGVFAPEEFYLASEHGFSVVFHSDQQISWLAGQKKLPNKLHSWLKLNTGLGRLGYSPNMAKQKLEELSHSSSIDQPVGIISQSACSNKPSNRMNAKQISVFRKFVKNYNGEKSFCNSAAIYAFPDMHYDWVRPGLALYGVSPLTGRENAFPDLKPVMTFQTELIAIHELKRGEKVGYCPQFKCREDMKVGIAAVGYSEGYPLPLKGEGFVLIKESRCPLIGRVTMNMIAINLHNCVDAEEGDKVTLWGEGLPIEEVSAFSLLPYALLTGVHENRVRFEWDKDLGDRQIAP